MSEKILLVDDEPNVLSGYTRSLRRQYDIVTAEGGELGLAAIKEQGPFGVIVADMRMPGMDGVHFLKNAKKTDPDAVRMMLTGNADQETAMNAVNQGNIFRFLTKPCPPQTLVAALALGLRQHKLIIAEKELLEKTLSGSIKILTNILSLTEHEIFATAERIRDYARVTASNMEIGDPWTLEVAAMMAPLGLLTLPPELREKIAKGDHLNEKEKMTSAEIPNITGSLLANIPRLENVAKIVETATGHEFGEKVENSYNNLQKEIDIMRIVTDIGQLESRGTSLTDAIEMLEEHSEVYPPVTLKEIKTIILDNLVQLGSNRTQALEVRASELLIGDIITKDVESLDDRMLLGAGSILTTVYLARLNNYRRLTGIKEPISIIREDHTN
ncbi:MAG: response regulator [Deltaproteobacteria bacterium]|nr:response regulator [Deltaproteobacteria bacterium]